LSYIRAKLKPQFKIGIISNAGADHVDDLLGSHVELFDDIVLSYKAGVIKPDPKIYQMSAANLAVKESECVFIDDILTYCQGAEAAGMKAIWYRDFRQMKSELEKILSADADN
jgi:epoxide hydrolase-like predicted phosphatase